MFGRILSISEDSTYTPPSYPNIHRINCYDANHSRYLALLSEHPEHDSCVSGHHVAANVLSRSVLEPPISLSAYPATQAPLVLRIQGGHRYGYFGRGGHRPVCSGWRCR